MAGTPLDAQERAALCDLFVALGPDAPTLCDGWTTSDLAAHLVVRERDPRSTPGILFGGRFGDYTERLMEKAKAKGYEWLVARVRSGPPIGPFKVPGLRELTNLGEYFIHHEDVRRANDRAARAGPPVAELQDHLWRLLERGARLQVRSVPKDVRVELDAPGHKVIVARKGGDGGTAHLAGDPGEITLYLAGRGAHADVAITGDPAAVEAVRSASFGV
jgi:uncharacterized protein (TIGR03085 family)